MIGACLTAIARSSPARFVIALSGALLTAGCIPGGRLSCNNRDVRASIADDALTSIATTLNIDPASSKAHDATAEYTLHDTSEIAREGDTLSCRGTLGMRTGPKRLPDVTLDYQVTKTNDGNILYAFNRSDFGPAIIGLMLQQGMAADGKKGAQNGGAATLTPTSPSGAPRPLPKSADPNWSQWRH